MEPRSYAQPWVDALRCLFGSPELALSHPYAWISHLLFKISYHTQWLTFAGKGTEIIQIQASIDECPFTTHLRKIFWNVFWGLESCCSMCPCTSRCIGELLRNAKISGFPQSYWIRIHILTRYFLNRDSCAHLSVRSSGLEASDASG